MQRPRWTFGLISIVIAISNMAFTRDASPPPSTSLVTAPAPNPPPGPDRFAIIAVEYTSYEWFVATWDGDNVVCTVNTDHESPPLPAEIYRDCGEKIYTKWLTQPPCNLNDIENCIGYYTFLINSEKKEKEIAMQLAPASAMLVRYGIQMLRAFCLHCCIDDRPDQFRQNIQSLLLHLLQQFGW